MAAKAILVLCAQAVLIQSVVCQFVGPAMGLASRDWAYDGFATPLGLAGRGLPYDGVGMAGRGWGCGCGPAIDFTATSGGSLPVTSGSAIPPVGLSVTSENVYEGILTAAGELPFVGTVEVDGVVPTAGAGAVNYGCGNGVTAMAADAAPGFGAYGAGLAGPLGYGAGLAGPLGHGAGLAGPLGYGAGLPGRGCGCGL